MGLYGGQGLNLSLRGQASNRYSLSPGATWTIAPAGWYAIKCDNYAVIQQRDPITGIWWRAGGGLPGSGDFDYIQSDGQNYRIANQTGCAVGACITNAGTGYTSAPTVTATAGSSIWQPIVGGAVNTSVTISNAGTNYTYPPSVQFSAPPQGGVQATGYSTLSGGTVASVVIVNQGAGYTTPPTITFVNDPREVNNPNLTTGYNAAALAALTGAGTITSMLCTDHGTPLTAVPTFNISGGGGSSFAATAIMCWTITGFTPTAGTGFTGNSLLSGLDAFPTNGTGTNPSTQNGLVATRQAIILMPESAGAPTATGAVFYDGGIYTSVPTALVTTNGVLISQTVTIAFTMGGKNATFYIQQC